MFEEPHHGFIVMLLKNEVIKFKEIYDKYCYVISDEYYSYQEFIEKYNTLKQSDGLIGNGYNVLWNLFQNN